MNENIDLTKILKDCPKGTKLYSTTLGDVSLKEINTPEYPIVVSTKDYSSAESFTKNGKLLKDYNGECILFPSKDQRDWTKFNAPWYNNEKFDPKTLQPFDKVLVRDECCEKWRCDLYSHFDSIKINDSGSYPYVTINSNYCYCIPYNDETKHLAGTTNEAPEYYKYWKD